MIKQPLIVVVITIIRTKNAITIPDTIKRFVVDDYPVTNTMLADKTSNSSSYKKQSGQTYSYNKAWFTNDTLNQSIIFELLARQKKKQ